MHDPMTVAHEIKIGSTALLTIWHKDPEIGGDEDSCDWFGSRKSRENGWYPVDLDGWDDLPEETRRAIDYVWWKWRSKLTARPWWKHPRWHIHHWEFQIHHLQRFKRWAFSRCMACGGRFKWGEAPISVNWYSGGPRWFESEPAVMHIACDRREKSKNERNI